MGTARSPPPGPPHTPRGRRPALTSAMVRMNPRHISCSSQLSACQGQGGADMKVACPLCPLCHHTLSLVPPPKTSASP